MIPNEHELKNALRALAAAMPQEPSADIENRLRLAFRQKGQSRKRRAWIAGSIAVAALAATLALLFRVPAQPAGLGAYIVHPAPPVLVAHASKPNARALKAVVKRVKPRPRVEDPPEVATKFYALPDADVFAPVEDGMVVRVQLPRSAMRMIGLPVNEERAAERIRADVVLGQDGIARAVRFIQ